MLSAEVIAAYQYLSQEYTEYFKPSEIPHHVYKLTFKDFPIVTIPSGSFKKFTSCVILNMMRTEISTIEKDAWLGLTKLQFLRVSFNKLTTISSDTFNHLDSLIDLDLFKNEIHTIEAGAFRNLDRLILSANMIRYAEVELEVWANLQHSLKTIGLSENIIQILFKDSFLHLGKLSSIDISYCDIVTIKAGAFNGLPLLKSLLLAGNKLTTLEWNAFNPNDFPKTGGHPGK